MDRVQIEKSGTLTDSSGDPHPATVTLAYGKREPFAVQARIASRDVKDWLWSREDMLAVAGDLTTAPTALSAGWGDVVMARYLDQLDELSVVLYGPDVAVTLRLPLRVVRGFLSRTRLVVP